MTAIPTGHQPGQRWRGLDAFRGLAVIGMLLVNNPGDANTVYSQLRHSKWNGCTLADLVFPFFLFVVGITTTISMAAMQRKGVDPRARTWRRAGLIFGIGLLLNWFPFYQSGHIAAITHVAAIDRVLARLLVLRIPGVLQRIAIAYLATVLIARRVSSRPICITTAALLLGYWLLLTLIPVPGEGVNGLAVFDQPSRTIVAHVDRALFDWTRIGLGNHLWDGTLTWDPEGVLSTVSSIATTLLGLVCGRFMLATPRDLRLRGLLITGAAAILAGWCWSFLFPLNKSLWTGSYVLFTAGVGAVLLGMLGSALDDGRTARWALPLLVFGANPLIAYAGSEVMHSVLHSSIKLREATGRVGLDEWTTHRFEEIGLSSSAASLGWTLLFIAAWFAVLSHLNRRRLFLRV